MAQAIDRRVVVHRFVVEQDKALRRSLLAELDTNHVA